MKYGSRNESDEEVQQYLLEKKGVYIGSNFNFGSLMLWILLVFAIVAGGIGIVKCCSKDKKEKIMAVSTQLLFDHH